MSRSIFIWGGVAAVFLFLVGFGGWLLTLPSGTAAAEAPPIPQDGTEAMLASLKPVKSERPLVAVIGIVALQLEYPRRTVNR